MKAYLMHVAKDFDLYNPLPANTEALSQDLGVAIVCSAMAGGDERALAVVTRALAMGLTEPADVLYRQEVLSDALANAEVVRRLYKLAVEAVEAERRIWGLSSGSPQLVLYRAVDAIALFVTYLKQLRQMAEAEVAKFSSSGFTRFFQMLLTELDEEYFAVVQRHLSELRFRNGVLISATLGEGLTSQGYVLRTPVSRSWRERLSLSRNGYSFEVPARDDAGNQILDGLRARGINLVANAAGQSAEHIRSFFNMVATELAFYVGCLNLHDKLGSSGTPTCMPVPVDGTELAFTARGLYDVGLALRSTGGVVGNDMDADGKDMIMVTGANQGGKSTFLRSVGLAQLMMQSGMFVGATACRLSMQKGVFTHFKREEDVTMTSGKFDEELARMSSVADAISPGCLLLCNESFASTNESEGSEIARQVIVAMVDSRVRVVFVTHMFELAEALFEEHAGDHLFLRAERLTDGTRTFRLQPGEPLRTSYGEDSYRRVFGDTLEVAS